MKFSSAYDPSKHEAQIYSLWEKGGAFKPQHDASKGYFSLVAPPPNANANLHIGYGLVNAIEDILVRYHRMKGESTLYVPGADHAGFETQSVYEKQLAKEGKSRFDFTRDQLYKQLWDFVAKNRGNFEKQFRTLGASFDWDYYTFTLDDKVIKQAYSTFKKMWDEGLIYRGERLVNFCTFHGTAFADIEVEYKDVAGHLWYIKYPLTDGSGEVVVATTRPETMLGDTAVAVNPIDARYKKYIGKTITLPLTGREVPIIADEMVDPNFGTGAVKITPAHDPNDYDVAQRHSLPMITVISHEGKMEHSVPELYRGKTVEDARKLVVRDLDSKGCLEKTEDYLHSVGHCYKCGTVIQPLLRDQWFVDMQPLAKKAIAALKDNQITFYPDTKREQLITYYRGLRDWNISRQIAWGIPIPAFQNVEDDQDWIFDERVKEEIIEFKGKKYRRDPDVFDTWFSSSSWPYVTLDYPDGEAFKKFYPLSVMETGGEILYPWVSRMIMLGLYVTGKVPFKEVYIHGYVMAEDGSKMSKSIGNVIDPTEVIEKYGSDALRMGIIAGRVPGVNRGYDSRKVEDARNFANKLWNISRFIEPKVTSADLASPKPKNLSDHWILNKLSISSKEISQAIDNYDLAGAYEKLYHFVWDDFADWYIEASKAGENAGILALVLESSLKLAHPFAPFVTEAIWQELGWRKSVLITEDWELKLPAYDPSKAREFESLMKIVSEVRNLAADIGLNKPKLAYKKSELISANADLISRLAKLGSIEALESAQGIRLVSSKQPVWLALEAKEAKDYVAKLESQIKACEESIKHLEVRLANKSYLNNAPESLVTETKQQLKSNQEVLGVLEKQLAIFVASVEA